MKSQLAGVLIGDEQAFGYIEMFQHGTCYMFPINERHKHNQNYE